MFIFDTTISSAVKSQDAPAQGVASSGPLGSEQLALTDRYWQAANYLTVGQIYLQDNALLTEPLGLNTSNHASSGTGARRQD